jgi:hypothetical protein
MSIRSLSFLVLVVIAICTKCAISINGDFHAFALSKSEPDPDVYYSDMFSDYSDSVSLSGLGDEFSLPAIGEEAENGPAVDLNAVKSKSEGRRLKGPSSQGFASRAAAANKSPRINRFARFK